MKIPLKWLKEYINVDLDPKEIARVLTLSGSALDKPIYEQGNDVVMDFEDRGNRSDVMGIVGMARDLAALTETELKFPDLAPIPQVDNDLFPVKVHFKTDKVLRWNAVVLKEVEVKSSPTWMQERLSSYGIEPKNNIVDITNYVMIEFGMPMHAFDLDKIDGEVTLRTAKNEEGLLTFEGFTLKLDEEDVVVADKSKPLALAPAIGGQNSGVTDKTKNVFLEVGLYDQKNARRSALKHNVRNDTSNRLGKYLHPHYCEVSLKRALKLVEEIASVKAYPASLEYYPNPSVQKEINLTQERLNLISGENIPLTTAVKELEKLEFEIAAISDESIQVLVPYFRTDVVMGDDLIEEILRIKGYTSLPSALPKNPPPLKLDQTSYKLENKIKDLAVILGFNEVIGEQIVDISDILKLHKNIKESVISLENSWNEELNTLRVDFVLSLLKYLESYKKHGASEINLFETGKVYKQNPSNQGYESYQETKKVGFISNSNYASLKGKIERLLSELGSPEPLFDASKNQVYDMFKQQIQADIHLDGKIIGYLGELKTESLDVFGLSGTVSYCEIDIDRLSKLLPPTFFPCVKTKLASFISEDLTFIVDESIHLQPLLIKISGILSEKSSLSLKSVYQNDKLKTDQKKSVTVSILINGSNASEAKDLLQKVKELTSGFSN